MKILHLFTSLIALLFTAQVVVAQTADAVSLIAPDSIGILTIQPAQLAKSPSSRRAPLEVISAVGLEYFGLDPLKLQRIDAIVGMPMLGSPNIPVAVCITHAEAIDKELLARMLPEGPMTDKGVEMWPIPQTPDFVLSLRSPNQALIGPRLQVLRLMKSTLPDGDLRSIVKELGNDATVQLVIALEPARDMLTGLTQMPQLGSIPGLAPNLATVTEKARMLAMQIHVGASPTTTYLMEGSSPADTMELAKAMQALIRLGMDMGLPVLEEDLRLQPGEAPKATLAYLKRLKTYIESNLNFKPEGKRLSIKMEGGALMMAQVGTLVGLLLPAVQAARDSARGMQDSNNMKQILLSIHNYEATFGYIPSDLGDGRAETKNKLSWRVHILPFIEQQALYQEFHLDEPWDSPHNIKLLERMPPTYKDPRSIAPPGHTVYQMPKGPKTFHNSVNRLRFRNITDGLSNVIAVMATTDQAAVPWTKPDEFDPVANPDSIAQHNGRFRVGMGDGSVKNFAWPLPADLLEALIMINDGRTVDFEELK